MNNIATKILYEMQFKRDCVFVLIIDQDGSAPRGKGSFMLIGENRRLFGTIGGGAVEKRSELIAKECLEAKSSAVHEFHLKPNDIEDIGMVCGGDVTVFFQYISGTDVIWKDTAESIVSRYNNRQNGCLILDLNGGAPAVTDPDGTLSGSGKGERRGDLFYYPLNTGERAILFGAGHCGRALAPILNSVGFRVVLFDNRSEYVSEDLYPYAEQVICGDYERISDRIDLEPEDYIVVMTSGHAFDMAVERQVLAEACAYIGVIGSAKKTAAVNQKLLEAGIPQEKLMSVYTPIGLPIKAVTPEEIAVSIAGEIIRVRANRRAGVPDSPTHQPVH